MFDLSFLPEIKMPEGFLWGAGYAGHQVEGNNVNSQNWHNEIKENYKEKSGLACNSYEMWKTDVAIAEQTGLQAFRTSVEWSRIEPQEGHFDQSAADHYVMFFSALKKKGIKVFATMVHLTYPMWFEKLGHFQKKENMKYFERYLEFIVPQISPYVDFWNVMNEFNLGNTENQIVTKLMSIQFHALGYHIIKKYSNKPVSSAHALVQYMPKRPFDRWDKTMAEFNDLRDHEFFFHAMRTGEILYPFRNGLYVPEVKNTVDFWSINTYVRELIDARQESSTGTRFSFKKMQMIKKDFYLEEINPECIINNLSRLTDKPIYITENGCACDDDKYRIQFMSVYIAAISEAIKLGADVRGFLYWSIIDNYEWFSYLPRFGLYSVDYNTFKRTPKPSASFYKEIIKNNGITPELISKYTASSIKSELPSLPDL